MKKKRILKKSLKRKQIKTKQVKVRELNPALKKELKELQEELARKEAIKERTWKDMRILWFSVAPYIKCYDEETEILTEKGWKKFENLEGNEKVLTFNQESKDLEWQLPIDYIRSNYQGPMYSIESKHISLLVTPNHRMLVAKRNQKNNWIFREEKALKLLGKVVKYYKAGKWKGKIDLTFQRGSLENWMKFLGYYLSEGHVDHYPIKGNYTVSLTQTKKTLKLKMKKIFQQITPFKVYEKEHHISVRDKELWTYLSSLGYSHEKHIPKEIKELPRKYLRILLEAYKEGDGHRQNSFATSEKLKDDLQEIILKAGYGSNCAIHVKKGKEGNFDISQYDCWRISNVKPLVTVNKGKQSDKIVEYEGKIYCVQVPNSWIVVRRKGKVCISGNSGYGIVTKHFVSRLIQRGFTSMVVAYYGLAKGGFLKVGDIVTFPIAARSGDSLGFKSVAQHHKKFNTDIVIFFTDFWVARPLTRLVKNCVAYTVLDHEDYAEEYQDVLRGFYKVAIASKHGCAEAKKYGIEASFIPHGVDLGSYHPLPKDTCKRMLGIPPETFLVGIVAANNDKEPRKGWDKMFSAIRIFLDNNPEMKKPGAFKIFIHTDAQNNRGYDLKLLAKRTRIGKYIIFQDPYISIIGLPDRLMNRIYNAFDVLMNLSRREGFCLPILEAQACKVPAIATDFSAMTERLNNGRCGWLIKPATTMLSPLGGITAIPDEFKAAEALEEAVFKTKKRELFAKRSLAFAKRQTWDIAIDKYWYPFLQEVWNDLKKPEKMKKPKVLFQSKKAMKERKK